MWKEHTAADGRKFYYNKASKESKWSLPDDPRVVAQAVDVYSFGAPVGRCRLTASKFVLKAPVGSALEATI